MMLVDPFRFAGSGPAVLEFVHAERLATLPGTETKISIPSYPIGTPRADRRVFVVLSLLAPAPITEAIGGNVSGAPMTIHVQQHFIETGLVHWHCLSLIASARVPAGTTGNIEIEFPSAVNGSPLVATYAATSMQSDNSFDAKRLAASEGKREYQLEIATAQDGFVLAVGTARMAGTGAEVIGTTTHYSENLSGRGQFGGGGETTFDPAHELIFSMIGGPSFGTMEGTFVAASFR